MRHGLAQRSAIARAGALLGAAALVFAATHACAAELEPRAYVNTPVGLNFLLAGYSYSEGGLSTNAASPISDANLQIHTEVLAYARTLDVWGKSGKFDVILPYSELSGTATVNGQPRHREISRAERPALPFLGQLLRCSRAVNRGVRQLPAGCTHRRERSGIGAPWPVDSSRLVNLGNNRWLIKPDIGISKALGSLTLELTTGVTFFTNNDDYYGGQTLEQDPVYSTQAHITYDFGRHVWGSLDGTYDYGGRTTVNGVRNDDVQKNSRMGVTLALPVNRKNSIKLYASTGVSTRTGSDYKLVGILWQYRWGRGL